jgi:hypothetical protein
MGMFLPAQPVSQQDKALASTQQGLQLILRLLRRLRRAVFSEKHQWKLRVIKLHERLLAINKDSHYQSGARLNMGRLQRRGSSRRANTSKRCHAANTVEP